MNVKRSLVLLAAGCLLWSACTPYSVVPGDMTAETRLTDTRFISYDGTGLPLRTWLPSGPAGAVMIALHGYNDYSNFINDAAAYFNDHGIAVYAFDQRGFGAAPHRGSWAGHETMCRDLRTIIALVRERYPAIPLFLLGDSMGGAVIMAADGPDNPLPGDGVILVAPAVWSRETMPFYQRWLLWLAAHTIPWVRLTAEHLDVTPSDNREMLMALGRDPLVIKKSRVDTVYGLVNLMDAAYSAAGRFNRNTLLLYGAKDEIIPPRPMTDVFRKRLHGRFSSPQRLLVYAKGYHMLLRDLQAETVWKDVLAWMRSSSGPLPSVRAERAREIIREEDITASLHPGTGN